MFTYRAITTPISRLCLYEILWDGAVIRTVLTRDSAIDLVERLRAEWEPS